MSWQYGNSRLATLLLWQEPGAAFTAAAPPRYGSGNSPWPTLMPPESVPELLAMWLLAICRLWPQAWTKIPPPPCELLRMPRPSMLDGLHQKLLGNGFVLPTPLGPQPVLVLLLLVSRAVPVGNVSAKNGFEGKLTPFESTVIAAPSSAPIKLGSWSN